MKNNPWASAYEVLESIYEKYPSTPWVLGLSGGVDSSVLLWCVSTFLKQKKSQNELVAVYVHHGIQQNTEHWEDLCYTTAVRYGATFIREQVTLDPQEQKEFGVEAAARTQRQRVLGSVCYRKKTPVLLLGAHQDDRIEGLLLNLVRGSGIEGLVSLKRISHTVYSISGNEVPSAPDAPQSALQEYPMVVVRPLLDIAKSQLEQKAQEEQILVVQDPSNQSDAYTRNMIRKSLLLMDEKISTQRSGWRKSAKRSMDLLQQSALALEQLAVEDLEKCKSELLQDQRALQKVDAFLQQYKAGYYTFKLVLKGSPLKSLSDFRVQGVLRECLKACGQKQMVSQVRLEQLCSLLKKGSSEKYCLWHYQKHYAVLRGADLLWFEYSPKQ